MPSAQLNPGAVFDPFLEAVPRRSGRDPTAAHAAPCRATVGRTAGEITREKQKSITEDTVLLNSLR